MTPEREKQLEELRAFAKANAPLDHCCFTGNHMLVALEGIDALRAELIKATDELRTAADLIDVRVKDERDQINTFNRVLIHKRDNLLCEKRGLEAAIKAVLDENQKLKAELEDRKETEQELSDYVKDTVIVKRGLFEENQKLRERVAKLREALDKIHDPRKRDHIEQDAYTQMGCIMGIAHNAVAQDDESEKRR